MLNLAFCDDDKDFLAQIVPEVETIFRHLKVETRSFSFKKGEDLIASFSKYQPYYDIIFLDIDMPQKDGKEVAKELRILDKKFKLIFITAYPQEALNTFQYDVIGFLPKSLIHERLTDVIVQVIDRINEDNPKTQIFKVVKSPNGSMDIKVPLDDIIYFECINRKVFVYTKRGTFILHNYQFSEIVQKYLPLEFVDIHRSCIVNIKYIFSIDETEISLDNGIRLPLSRRKRQNIFDKFSEIISGDDII
jgi:DNA-binding LytR/AlgR family response regulator